MNYFAAHDDVPVYDKLRTILLQTITDIERRNLKALFAANDEVDTLYTHRMGERGERASEAGGDTTDSIRKEAANLISEIIATVNAAQRLLPSEELDCAVAALAGVIEQYKLVAAGHGGKKETPPPVPESASEAGK